MNDTLDLARRNFLLGRVAVTTEPEAAETEAMEAMEASWDDYFGSYEMACAQVNEARPFLAEDARRLGIDTEGMSDLEILKAIFVTTGRPQG